MMKHLGDFMTGKTGHNCLTCLYLSKKFKMMLIKSSLKKVPLLKMSLSFYWAVNPLFSTFLPISLKLSMLHLYWSSTYRICICRPQFHLWCGPVSQLQPCFLEACTCSSPSAPPCHCFPHIGILTLLLWSLVRPGSHCYGCLSGSLLCQMQSASMEFKGTHPHSQGPGPSYPFHFIHPLAVYQSWNLHNPDSLLIFQDH